MKPAQKRIPLFAYLILTIVGLVGIFGLCSGLLELFQALQCKNWPQTEGIIQSVKMTHSSNKHDIYGVKISYQYKVANISYSSERVSFGELETTEESHAQAILDRYPVGKQVMVFYSIANPTSAVLETGIHGQTWVTLIVSTSFLGAVLFILFLIRKKVPVGRSPVVFINS
jgi:hypothetical protein